jgi:hypothetical protein
VEDIPKVQPSVTENVIYEYYCAPCGTIVSAPVTDALPRATLGVRLTLLSAFLHYALGMTTRNICTWLRTFCQFTVTPGGLVLQWQRLAAVLKPLYDDLAEAAKLSAVLNVDESGWRILGRTAWLWCFTSARLAYYVLTPSRAGPVIKQVLGEIFKGILITDFFGAYDRIQAFAKQKCIVHLLREIKQVSLRVTVQAVRKILRDISLCFCHYRVDDCVQNHKTGTKISTNSSPLARAKAGSAFREASPGNRATRPRERTTSAPGKSGREESLRP